MSGSGPDPELVASAAHVFVTSLAHPVLTDDERHHLAKVLRLRPGDPVSASDGAGAWVPCRWAADGTITPEGEVRAASEPPYAITVAFALPKGDRPELVVQKLTELGADRIVPMTTDRCVVRLDRERAARQHERWSRIAAEAARQSRRVRLPVVESLATFADVADRPGAFLAAPGGSALRQGVSLLLIGPEGGWSEDELRRPLSRVGLGETILRAETAAIAGCALAVSARAEVVGL